MKRKVVLFTGLFLLFVWGLCLRCASEKDNFSQLTSNAALLTFCQKAATDPKVFQTFKRDPLYTLFYENTAFEEGPKLFKAIEELAPQLLKADVLERVREIDLVGSPYVYQYDPYGPFSPTSVHLLKVAADLMPQLKEEGGLRIVEIGGGSGNLCKVLHEIFDVSHYTIVALAEELELIKVHLEAMGIEGVELVTPEEISIEPSSLLISLYTFSESSEALQRKYIKRLFRGAERGYFVCNFLPKHFAIDPMSRDRLLHKVQRIRPNASIALEEPQVDRENYLLTWGKSR